MIKELKVFVHYTDNGDGSNSAHLYPSRDSLAKELLDYGTTIEKVESYEDPYTYGTSGETTIRIKVNEETGELSLAGWVSLSSD